MESITSKPIYKVTVRYPEGSSATRITGNIYDAHKLNWCRADYKEVVIKRVHPRTYEEEGVNLYNNPDYIEILW